MRTMMCWVVVAVLAWSCVVNCAPAQTVNVLFGYTPLYDPGYQSQLNNLNFWLSRATIVNKFNIIPSILDANNFEDQLNSATMLVLGSSNSTNISVIDPDVIYQFVQKGGVLVVPSYYNVNSNRNDIISSWLDTPEVFAKFLGENRYGDSYLTKYGLGTPFARIEDGNYPTNYDFVNAKIKRTQSSYSVWKAENGSASQYCMFSRDDEDCWLYAFPVGEGWQVNIPFDLNNYLLFYSEEVKDVFLAIAGLANGNINRNVITDATTLVYVPDDGISSRDVRRLLADIDSASDNVFVFTQRNPNIPDDDLFGRFNIQSVVIPNYLMGSPGYSKVDIDIDSPFAWLDTQNALVITLPGNQLGDRLYNYVNYDYPEESGITKNKVFVNQYQGTLYEGFDYIDQVYFPIYTRQGSRYDIGTGTWLPYTRNSVFHIPVIGSEPRCIFQADGDCILFTNTVRDGHVSFMSKPNKDFYPYFTPSGDFRDSEWQRESLRALVGASLDPTGESVPIPGPVLVPGNAESLNVLFVNTPGVRTAGVAGYMLHSLNNNVHSVEDINDIPSVAYAYDAIVLAGIPTLTEINPGTIQALKDFMENGKRIAWLVDKNRQDAVTYINAKTLFSQLEGYLTISPPYYNYYFSQLVSHKLVMQKNPTFKGGKYFDSVDESTVYPFFITKDLSYANKFLSPPDMGDCVISFVDGQCATIYYHYGAGAFTVISTVFQYGYQYWIEDYAPWANMLLRAVGGDPNAPPSSTPTISTTPSVTPIQAPSATSSISPTATPSHSPTTSGTSTDTPSITPSGTSTITSSVTSGLTPSETPSNTPSVIVTGTPTMTQTITPTISGTLTSTASNTLTPTWTPTMTQTSTETFSLFQSNVFVTGKPVFSPSSTESVTPSSTTTTTGTETHPSKVSSTPQGTVSGTASNTLSSLVSETSKPNNYPSSSMTNTDTPTSSVILTSKASSTPQAITASRTISKTGSPTRTPTRTPTDTIIRFSIAASLSATISTSHIISPIFLPPEPSIIAISHSPSITVIGTLSSSSTSFPSRVPDISVGGVMLVLPDKEVGETKEVIQVVSPDGQLSYGSIKVPDKFSSGVLSVTVLNSERSGEFKLATPVFEIILRDAQNNEVHDLDDSLEICFDKPEKESKNYCLGYYKDGRGWTCEDRCLDTQSDEYCGNTDHLTNFALLLTGLPDNGKDDPCESEESYVIAWIALAFLIVAIILVCLSSIVIEAKYRRKRRLIRHKLTRGLTKQA